MHRSVSVNERRRSSARTSVIRLSQCVNDSEESDNESENGIADADEKSKIFISIAAHGIEAAADGNSNVVENVLLQATTLFANDLLFTMKRFLEICNEDGYNMLHVAIIHKKPDVIATLFGNANPFCFAVYDDYYKGLLLIGPATTNGKSTITNIDNESLFCIKFSKHLDKKLALHLINCLTKDKNGDTPLTLAIRTYKKISTIPIQEEDYNVLNSLVKSLQILDSQKHPSSLKIIQILIENGITEVNTENSKGDTPLILATKVKNHEVVEELCKTKSLDVNHRNVHGKTALHCAVALNHEKIADTLLNYGGSVSVHDNDGYTPLHTACKYGRVTFLSKMLEIEKSFDVDLPTKDGKTLLHVARCAVYPSMRIIEILIKKGPDLRKVDRTKNTALHLFSSKDDVDACKAILIKAKEQDVDLLKEKNIIWEIPLHVAAFFGHVEVCKCFVEYSNHTTLVQKDIHGYIPIMKAIVEGHQAVVQVMLENCKVTEKVQHQKTLLEWAIENEYSVLIKAMHHLCTEKKLTMKEKFYVSPSDVAEAAVVLGKEKILQLLFQEGGENTLRIEDCPEILHTCVKHGNLNCIEVIYKCAEQIPISDDTNKATPLHIACQHGDLEIVKYLLGQDPKQNAWRKSIGLPISCAAANGHEELVKYLLDNSALLALKPEFQDCSPLLLAAIHGHERVVEILLEEDEIDVNSKSARGYNCLCEAIAHEKRSVVLAILKNKERCKQAMKFRIETNYETPLRMMIQHMPDLAEYALYQCCIDENEKEKQITFIFEILDDCRTCDGIISSYIGERVKRFLSRSANSPTIDESVVFPEVTTSFVNPPYIIMENTDSRETLQGNNCENGHDHDANNKWLQPIYDKDKDVLQLMVKYKRISLLSHPVVFELLKYKWRHFGLPAFIFHFMFYVMVVVLLTSMVLVAPLPHGPMCSFRGCWSDWGSWSACQNLTQCNMTRTRSRTCSMPEPGFGYKKDCVGSSTESMVCSNESLLSMEVDSPDEENLTATMCEDSCRYDYSNFKNMNCQQKGISNAAIIFLHVSSILLLIIMSVLIVLNVMKFYRRRLIYLQDLVTYIEAVLAVSTFVFVILYLQNKNDCFCASVSAWEAAVLAVFFGWMGLILHLTKLPLTGIIINMLLSIFYTFMKLAIILALLCFAFALPFYMLLTEPDRRTPFSNFGRSLLKTLVMTTGEFEFDTIFINEQDLVDDGLVLLFPSATSTLWIVFIVTMPILFNNLLVGLAVGDIQNELDKAQLTKFKLQIRIITELQKVVPLVHVIKRSKLVISSDNGPWIDRFLNSTTFRRRQKTLIRWKKRPDIAPFFEKEETVDPIEKIIATQNVHCEKLNQLEHLLKTMEGFSKTTPKTEIRPRGTSFGNVLNDRQQNEIPSTH